MEMKNEKSSASENMKMLIIVEVFSPGFVVNEISIQGLMLVKKITKTTMCCHDTHHTITDGAMVTLSLPWLPTHCAKDLIRTH